MLFLYKNFILKVDFSYGTFVSVSFRASEVRAGGLLNTRVNPATLIQSSKRYRVLVS